MPRFVTYEIYVLQHGRWEIHARHTSAEKDAAIEEAKQLQRLPKIDGVRITRETYDNDTGETDEATIYKSEIKPQKPGAKKSGGKPRLYESKGSRGVGTGGGGGGSARSGAGEFSGRAARPVVTSGIGLTAKLLMIVLLALGFAAVATVTAGTFMVELAAMGIAIPVAYQGHALLGVFVVTFLAIAAPIIKIVLSRTKIASSGSSWKILPRRGTAPAARVARPMDATEPLPEDVPAEVAPSSDEALEAADKKLEEAKEEAEEAKNELSIDGEKQKVFMMMFLSESLKQLRTTHKTLDNYLKFGTNLFLAGAAQGLAQARNLDSNTARLLLVESLQILGIKRDQADAFAEKCDEYLLADTRYMQIYESGRNAMTAHAAGETQAVKQLQVAIVEWSKPKAKETKTGPVTVMFTDIVGSTALTQTKGDAAAQEMVRAHNRIVRDALTQYGGKEIKHTGDGIMASFPTTSNGVEAAIQIQRRADAHSKTSPDLPVLLRLGINAGELIAEEDDLFGSTVQLAARITAAANPGEILVSEIVRGICAGKSLAFAKRGEFKMKGFNDPITLHQVIWDANAQPAAQTASIAAAPAVPAFAGAQAGGPIAFEEESKAVAINPMPAQAPPAQAPAPARPPITVRPVAAPRPGAPRPAVTVTPRPAAPRPGNGQAPRPGAPQQSAPPPGTVTVRATAPQGAPAVTTRPLARPAATPTPAIAGGSAARPVPAPAPARPAPLAARPAPQQPAPGAPIPTKP